MSDPLDAVASDAESLANIAGLALQLGEEAAPFVNQIVNLLKTRTPLSESQRAELLEQEQTLRARLQAPLS